MFLKDKYQLRPPPAESSLFVSYLLVASSLQAVSPGISERSEEEARWMIKCTNKTEEWWAENMIRIRVVKEWRYQRKTKSTLDHQLGDHHSVLLHKQQLLTTLKMMNHSAKCWPEELYILYSHRKRNNLENSNYYNDHYSLELVLWLLDTLWLEQLFFKCWRPQHSIRQTTSRRWLEALRRLWRDCGGLHWNTTLSTGSKRVANFSKTHFHISYFGFLL